MPVFLSHKKEDKKDALQLAAYLKTNGIACYVDVLDPSLSTTTDITSTIRKRVRQCTHLMALISNITERSWWVPFEIGVATEIDRRISSFQTGSSPLPEYLETWPILRTRSDLDAFVLLYRRDTSTSITERRGSHATIRSADQFHRELKSML